MTPTDRRAPPARLRIEIDGTTPYSSIATALDRLTAYAIQQLDGDNILLYVDRMNRAQRLINDAIYEKRGWTR